MIPFITPERLGRMTYIHGLHEGRVLHRIHKHYCRKMNTRGKCDMNCEVTCKESIERIFRKFERAKDPYALLVWRSREAIALIDEQVERGGPVQDEWGEPKFNNVFQHLSEEFDEREAKKN